ncbi:MAG: PaaI family thioesterase [Leptospirales bacterium]|nr:PaaI family thioesterase [Leptospirales bacterium]
MPADEYRPTISSQDLHSPQCYGCGSASEHGLRADFSFHEESGEVRFRYVPQSWQRGAPGYMHGGVLAAILDEAQGNLCYHVGHAVMTDQLHMKYHRATPLDRELEVRAWITAVRKKRLYTRASILSAGELRATSSASWYLLSERLMERLFGAHARHEDHQRMLGLLEANRRRARSIRRRIRQASEPDGGLPTGPRPSSLNQ